MIFSETIIRGLFLVKPEPKTDDRGYLSRIYCKKEFSEITEVNEFVQMNQTLTIHKGTLRGLHYQNPPHMEKKLIRCIRGSVFDVVVDLRSGSPTFLQWFGAELSATNQTAFYVPEGCAHGFQTLEDNCEMTYCHTEFYSAEAERGIRFDDPRIAIRWPLAPENLSGRDSSHPLIPETFQGI